MTNYWKIILSLSLCIFLSISLAYAQKNKENDRIIKAIDVLDDLSKAPEEGIPPALLHQAEALAIFPHVIKGGLIVGGRHGKGIVMVREADGSWSNPAFLNISGGSIGLQIGGQSSDIVLVFRDRKTIERIGNGDFTLGADAAIAAGPAGREVGASTNYKFQAEVYSYARSRGLFAGLSLEGSSIKINEKSNWAFYEDTSLTLEDIFAKRGSATKEIKGLHTRLQKMEN